jgi:hypothetical protein
MSNAWLRVVGVRIVKASRMMQQMDARATIFQDSRIDDSTLRLQDNANALTRLLGF